MIRINYRAFSLIELVIIMATVGIIVAVATGYIREVIDLWNFLSFRNEIGVQARFALLRMIREIRQIQNRSNIFIAENQRLVFNTSYIETINYTNQNFQLFRNNQSLLSVPALVIFRYYNQTNVLLTAPVDATNRTQIRRIEIMINLSYGNQDYNLRTQVFGRNL
ncbi:MAG: hypothetical protein N2606_00935 [Candidatus Omnitrophica bacterium]|nr:hypothetical protein [Candidatus Omnitrophota bacterium]